MQNPLKSQQEVKDDDTQKPLHRATFTQQKNREITFPSCIYGNFQHQFDGDDGPRAGDQFW